MLSTGNFMFIFSLAYLFVKIWGAVHASSIYNRVNECVFLNVTSDKEVAVAGVLAQSVVKRTVSSISISGIVGTIALIFVSIHYIAKASSKRARARHIPHVTRWNNVTKPMIAILLGTITLATDLAVTGAIIVVPIEKLTRAIENDSNPACSVNGLFSTLRALIWTSTALYVLILVVGHRAGLIQRYRMMKREEVPRERRRHVRDDDAAHTSCSDSDDPYSSSGEEY